MEKAISIIKKIVEDLKLPTIKTLDYLNNSEPIIYLCGKSNTGKTTFLNALFNMNKNELYTSTNISTKTEFRFKFDTQEKITKSNGVAIDIPSNEKERKKLFETLNNENDKYKIYLNQKALYGRTIVDIPGVFDFNRDNEFSNQMLDEANCIYFFTPCTAKVSSLEYELLQSISNMGIPIVVLFTMGDITEVDEGITRKTLPNLVKTRLNTCFNHIEIKHSQIISSNDFYKKKDTHGIDRLQLHINNNDMKYKNISEKNKLQKTITFYIDLINDKLIIENENSKTYKKLIERKNQLWFKTENIKIKENKNKTINNIKTELNWLYKNCENIIYGKFTDLLMSKQSSPLSDQKNEFYKNWDDFWIQLNIDFSFLEIKKVRLPVLNENIFKKISINLDKIKTVIAKKEEVNISEKQEKNQPKNKTPEKTPVNKSEKLSYNDWWVIVKEFGINLNNGKIVYQKWSSLNEIKDIISNNKNSFIKKIDYEFETKTNELKNEKNKRIRDEEIKNPALKNIKLFNNALIKLKSI